MTKEVSIPVSWLWKTPLGWIIMVGLMTLAGGGAWGITNGNAKGDSIALKVERNTSEVEHIKEDIREIKEICREINQKLDRRVR